MDHRSKAWYKRQGTFIAGILALLAIIIGVVFYALSNNSSGDQPAANQTLTLYYNDGKTVLWQTGQPEADNAAFIAYVRNQIKTVHGEDYQSKGAWKVTTTMDKRLQDAALEQLKSQRSAINMSRMDNLILMAEDAQTGQVVSLATQQTRETGVNPIAERVPAGTLATPFSYIALLEKFPDRASDTFEDTQGPLPGYPCVNRGAPSQGGNCLFNMDMRYNGTLTLAQALGGFRNVTAVKALSETGNATYEIAAKMGSDGTCYIDQELTEKTPCYSAAAFGEGLYITPQRMMQAYATLANQGSKVPQVVLLKTFLDDKQQYAWKAPKADRIISAVTAQTISGILADPNVSFITESRKAVFSRDDGKKAAIVSGFMQQSTHASSVQFTDQYVVGFWGSAVGSELVGSPVLNVALPVASGLLKATK